MNVALLLAGLIYIWHYSRGSSYCIDKRYLQTGLSRTSLTNTPQHLHPTRASTYKREIVSLFIKFARCLDLNA